MQEPIQSRSSKMAATTSSSSSSQRSPVSSSTTTAVMGESGSDPTASTSKLHFPGTNSSHQNVTSANASTSLLSNGPSSHHGGPGGAGSAPNPVLVNGQSHDHNSNAAAGPSTSPSSSSSTRNPPQQQQQHYAPQSASTSSSLPNTRLPRPSETFTRQLSNVLQHAFLPSVLPTAEEYQIKENARKFLQDLADRISPGAKLLPFGSQANGMALRNSG
jgi:terminal uridylyltransferase